MAVDTLIISMVGMSFHVWHLLLVTIPTKDSIGTKDKLNTTCGSYALLGSTVARDAGVVQQLRRAGAVILGKASLNEWYGLRSLAIPGGWCARGGQAVVSLIFE